MQRLSNGSVKEGGRRAEGRGEEGGKTGENILTRGEFGKMIYGTASKSSVHLQLFQIIKEKEEITPAMWQCG